MNNKSNHIKFYGCTKEKSIEIKEKYQEST